MVFETEMRLFYINLWDFLECLHELATSCYLILHTYTRTHTNICTAVRTGVVLSAQFALGLRCVFNQGNFHSKNGNDCPKGFRICM